MKPRLPAPGAALAAAARGAAAFAASAPPSRRLHDARVASKRLRSLWRLLTPAVGTSRARLRRRALSRASRVLSDARDAESQRALALDLARAKKGPAWLGLGALIRRLPRPAGRDALAGPLASLTRAMDASARALGRTPTTRAAARDGLSRLHGRLERAAARAARDGRPEDFHETRKRAKDLQYALEALGRRPDAAPAREAAARLGRARDLTRLARLADGALARELERLARRDQSWALERLSRAATKKRGP